MHARIHLRVSAFKMQIGSGGCVSEDAKVTRFLSDESWNSFHLVG